MLRIRLIYSRLDDSDNISEGYGVHRVRPEAIERFLSNCDTIAATHGEQIHSILVLNG